MTSRVDFRKTVCILFTVLLYNELFAETVLSFFSYLDYFYIGPLIVKHSNFFCLLDACIELERNQGTIFLL